VDIVLLLKRLNRLSAIAKDLSLYLSVNTMLEGITSLVPWQFGVFFEADDKKVTVRLRKEDPRNKD
jgi:hypothetical protein